MKKYITFILSFMFILSLQAQDTPVSQKEFNLFRTAVQDSIRQIGERVDNGAETLDIAKEYSESADKLQSIFLAFLGLLLAAVALFAGLGIYKHFKINKKIAEYERELDRLLRTENETILLKRNAGILILHKGPQNKDDTAFKTLEKSIVNQYDHAIHASLENLTDFKMDIFSNKGFNKNYQPKVVVLNDDLFAEFVNDKGFVKEENKKTVKDFLYKLEKENIGLVLFGNTKLKDFNHPYLAFANQPYSVYANLNNLLKYMQATKK